MKRFFIAALAALLCACSAQIPPREFNWAIQGELSHRNCDTQPGAHPWYIENDGREWFMGCRKQAKIGILPGNDPSAPPPSDALLQFIIVHSTSEWKRFDTLHAAAMYAALRLENCSHYYECSGYIAKDPKGKFVVSPTRTDYNSDSVRVEDENAPSDWVVVADVHSHPCVPHHYTGLFSPQDMIGSITHRMTAYMVDLCTGDVHEFVPGVSKIDAPTQEDGEWLSAGTVIAKVSAYPSEPLAHEGL